MPRHDALVDVAAKHDLTTYARHFPNAAIVLSLPLPRAADIVIELQKWRRRCDLRPSPHSLRQTSSARLAASLRGLRHSI